jgi:hypothetical protein
MERFERIRKIEVSPQDAIKNPGAVVTKACS